MWLLQDCSLINMTNCVWTECNDWTLYVPVFDGRAWAVLQMLQNIPDKGVIWSQNLHSSDWVVELWRSHPYTHWTQWQAHTSPF